jgi:hypothetical protein
MSTVCVQAIHWVNGIPFGRVGNSHTNLMIPLIHSSFISAYCIVIGTELIICPETGYIHRSRPGPNVGLVAVRPDTSDIFSRWFIFRDHLTKHLGYKIIRILFLSGLETVEALLQIVSREHFMNMKGIGVRTATRIMSVIEILKSRLFLYRDT